MLARIAHTTDFSPQSEAAFYHALRLALASRGRLDLLHVREPGSEDAWQSFPHVREVLARWGLVDARIAPADIEAKVGIRVAKVEIKHADVVRGISDFILTHRPDFMVVATHGRHGVNRWLHGSVSEEVARRSHVPTLLIGPESRDFVDSLSGAMSLERVLLPAAHTPPPTRALDILTGLLAGLGVSRAAIQLMHVEETEPIAVDDATLAATIERFEGPVVDTILRVADERRVDLIAMPTAGHHGFLDGFRGSTTSRVLAHAPCPVLTLPLIARDGA
jgi:nucleotide-binding universal stress UspA family protein